MDFFEKMKSEKDLIQHLYHYITKERHMMITKEEVSNLYFSLKTQKLVILNSKPGMGKTELCLAYVDAFRQILDSAAVESIFINVGKDYDKTDLLGYVGLDEIYRPSEFAQRLFNLQGGIPQPSSDFKIYFIILDEMNLSQVDFYFNQILAAIENNQPVMLPNNAKAYLPENTFIMGTINSYTYESTRNPLSGGVKRRANIINVPNPLDYIFALDSQEESLREFKETILRLVNQSTMKFEASSDILSIFRALNFEQTEKLSQQALEMLFQLATSLSVAEESKLTLGILQDIVEYMLFSNFELTVALDKQIVQKILPHLTGNVDSLINFESFLSTYELTESMAVFARAKMNAQHNMGYLSPLC